MSLPVALCQRPTMITDISSGNVKEPNLAPEVRESSFFFGRRRRPAGVRRRITPEVGRGLEKLGHAVEYLTDEFVHEGCRFVEDRARLEAIALLASLKRQIYFSCEVEPTFMEQVHALFRWLWKLH